MGDLESFKTAVTQALAPALRDAMHGRDVDKERVKERLEYQLEGRGFTVVEKDTDDDTPEAILGATRCSKGHRRDE